MRAVMCSSETASTATFLEAISSFTTSSKPLCAAWISVVTPFLSWVWVWVWGGGERSAL